MTSKSPFLTLAYIGLVPFLYLFNPLGTSKKASLPSREAFLCKALETIA